jgi:RNA polymerase sigma-70 factor (ECF subfamily)
LDVADRLPDTDEPHGRLERRELSRELARLLGRLTKQRRVVVVLRLIHQHSITEIADMLGIPVNTVRDRLQVGRRELRKWISRDQRLRELTNRRAP